MTDRNHPCISLVPSGNFQGSLKCFDLLTSKVVICHTLKEFPYTRRYLKLTKRLGKLLHTKEYGNKPKVLDKKKQNYH